MDDDATSLPIHSFRAGEEGETDRKAVNTTKKGASERKKNDPVLKVTNMTQELI